MRIIFLLFTFICFSLTPKAWASYGDDVHDLYTGARAEGMGNAFVGLADDEEAIFYNPAGMAGNHGVDFNFFSETVEVSGDAITTLSNSVKTFNNINDQTLNSLMGQDIYLHSQFAPSITMHNFGFAVLIDDQFSFIGRNTALPQIQLGDQQTNGFQAAYGFSVFNDQTSKTDDLRFGVAGKLLWRRGGYNLLTLDQLADVGTTEYHKIVGDYGEGVGMDLGTQYIHTVSSRFKMGFGVAMTDVGNTSFSSGADPQLSNLTMGIFGKYHFGPSTNLTVTYDYRNALNDIDFREKNHFGVEMAFPLVSFEGGFNQVSYTYGVGLNIWLLSLRAVSYSEEESALAFGDTERRYMLQLGLKFAL